MEILWELETATSEQVRKRLSGKPHDSSVRTLLRVLERKSFVKVDSTTRPSTYRAAVPRKKAQKKAVSRLIDRLFSGSAESLVARLIEDKQLTLEQLEEIKQSLRKQRKSDGRKSR